jgi:hypothetical protein
MATRTIVTSQPDVACDVCARRLLRGEHADVFVGAGRRRVVCDLCAPRAVHEGWMRETDSQPPSLPPARPRRGGGLLERLRRVAQPASFDAPGRRDASVGDLPATGGRPATMPLDGASEAAGEALGRAVEEQAVMAPELPGEVPAQSPGFPGGHAHDQLASPSAALAGGEAPLELAEGVEQAPSYLWGAIEVFNASEFPRRVAGVIRSLGAPLVTVRSAEHLASVVRIVVAWELCWYRYEVDLSEPVVEAQVIAQGTELAELAREDRVGNGIAADAGTLLLAGGA